MSKLTKKDTIKEIIKCGKDPEFFINEYAKIQHPTLGLLPFKLYPYQSDIVKAFTANRKNIILKARQLGVTTVTAAYMAWFLLFHRDKNVLIVATKQETSKNMIRIIRNIYKYLPKWMMDIGKIKVDNRHSIEMENGCRVKAVTTTEDVGRSEAVSWLVVDEVAFIKNFEEIWTGISPTIAEGGRVSLFSTPNGISNFFHDCYVKAQNNENGFNCRYGTYTNPNDPSESYDDRFPWWVHPNHDLTWFTRETQDKSPRETAQEFLCNFLSSGETFIAPEDIAALQKRVRSPAEMFHLDRSVWIWEHPNKIGSYIIGCDVSRGDAQDYSAFHVLRIDCSPLMQVAEYKGKIRPDQLGILLMAVSQYYNNAIIAPENNSGWSGQAIMKIEEAGYPFLYYSRKRKLKEKESAMVDPYYAALRNDFLPGYAVTSANRIQMLAKMEQYIRSGEIVINSPRTLAEFKDFIVTDANRPEAIRGRSDDLIMALAGTLWVREEAFLHTYRSDELTKALLNSISISSNKSTTYANLGNSSFTERARIVEYVQDQQKLKMGSGNEEDISWLLTKG